ncbi:hypothetical protein KY326_01725 [Candidatus Woesearchaeota archaeon]|nr:hypothetical protein [Candidatus Woesearchaeota archaeon]
MRKLHIIAMILLAITVLAVGCAQRDVGEERGIFGGDKGTVETRAFIGGTNGLLLEFSPDRPRDKVFSGGADPFDVEIQLINDGEWEVMKDDVTVTLSGLDPAEFGYTEARKNPDEDLLAKYRDPQGTVIPSNAVYIIYESLNREQPVLGDTTYPVRADICYKYGTNAISSLCIRKDLRSREEGVCAVDGSRVVQNSASPVQVVELTENAASSTALAFTFRIQKKGNGKVYRLASDCNPQRVDENRVFVEIDTGLPGLVCSGLREGSDNTGYADLRAGEAIIRCKQDIAVQNDFVKSINIKLQYDYKETISTSIAVLPEE